MNTEKLKTMCMLPVVFIKKVLLMVKGAFKGKSSPEELVVYSAPDAYFLWVVVAMGFILKPLTPEFISNTTAAWLFIGTMIYFIFSVVYDINVKKLLLITLVTSTIWLLARYIENMKNVEILTKLMKHFASLNPKYDSGTVSTLSWLLTIPWICSLFEMYFNRRKKFSPNEISEFHFGEGSELTDRAGLRFITKYRNVFQTLLGFGAGDILAVDNRHNVIKRYENVVGLWFKWSSLDKILHQRATLVDDEIPEEPKVQ